MGRRLVYRFFPHALPVVFLLGFILAVPFQISAEPAQDSALAQSMRETRNQALQLMRMGRYEEVWRLPDSLARLFPNDSLLLFSRDEEEVMLFLSRRWGRLLESDRWNRDFTFYLEGRSAPEPDHFGDSLLLLFQPPNPSLEPELDRAELEPYQREFLRLLYLERYQLRHHQHGHFVRIWRSAADWERLNGLSDEWLRRFPGRPYESEIRNDIRVVLKPDWLGFACEAGTSLYKPFGAMGRTVERSPAFGFGAEMMVSWLSLRGQIMRDGFTRLKRDLVYDGYRWEAGTGYEMTYLDLQGGIEAWRSKAWRVVPYALLGAAGFANGGLRFSEEDGELEPSVWRTCAGFGIQVQRFFTKGWRTSPWYAGLGAGMRYPRLQNSLNGMSGGEAFLELKLGYSARGWVRQL